MIVLGWLAVRERETNAGDFVADAYRAVTGADVTLSNGGGIRANIEIGDIVKKVIAILMVAVMLFSFAACNKDETDFRRHMRRKRLYRKRSSLRNKKK